jgi:hypothetical protein
VVAAEGRVVGSFAMFQEDGCYMGVPMEEADEFGTAVASKSNDTDLSFHDCLFVAMNNNTMVVGGVLRALRGSTSSSDLCAGDVRALRE